MCDQLGDRWQRIPGFPRRAVTLGGSPSDRGRGFRRWSVCPSGVRTHERCPGEFARRCRSDRRCTSPTMCRRTCRDRRAHAAPRRRCVAATRPVGRCAPAAAGVVEHDDEMSAFRLLRRSEVPPRSKVRLELRNHSTRCRRRAGRSPRRQGPRPAGRNDWGPR